MGVVFRDHMRKEALDRLAPNNPVKVKNGFITSVVNQMALDEERKVHPTLAMLSDQEKRGYGFNRPMEPDVMFKGKTPLLAAVLKAEMEWWASEIGMAPVGAMTRKEQIPEGWQ